MKNQGSVSPNRPTPTRERYYQLVKGVVRSSLSVVVRSVGSRHFVPLCLTSSVAIRVLWIALIFSYPVSDFAWYYQRSWDLAMGKGYSVDGEPTAYWPVGYPAFLGLIYWALGLNLLYAKLANVLLYLGVLCLSYSIAKKLFSSEFAGRMTLLLLAFYPNHIAYSSLVSPETLFLFLLLLGTALIMFSEGRLRMAAVSGVVFGAACLVKPQAVFIPLILLLTLNFKRRRSDSARRFLAIFVMVHGALGATILPWIARNSSVFGAFVFISNNGGINLLIGNNPNANGTYVPFNDGLASLLGLEPNDDEHDVDVKARDYALKYMLKNPVKTLKLGFVKLYYLYNEDAEGSYWNDGAKIWKGSYRPSSEIFFWWFIGLSQSYYVCTMAAFIVSLLVLLKERRSGPVPTAGLWVIGYLTLIYMVTVSNSRHHFPFIPWILMYVSWLIEWASSRLCHPLPWPMHS